MKRFTVRIALGIASVTVTLAVLEAAVRLCAPQRTAAAPPGSSAYQTTPYEDVGTRLRPSTRFRAVKVKADGGPCYDVVYSADEHGRRVVGAPRERAADRPRLALFGCSFTFGEGLPDEETLSHRLGEHFEVFDYAMHGYGPQQTLNLIRKGVIERELPEGKTLGLYVLYHFHLSRAVLGAKDPWLWKSAFYELDEDGRLVERPPIHLAEPLRFRLYGAIERVVETSQLARMIRTRAPLSPRRAELTAAILIDAARRFEEERRGPFAVGVINRGSDGEGVDELVRRLRAAGVTVLDEGAIPKGEYDTVCAGDGHPSARFIAELSRRLTPQLRTLATADEGAAKLPAAGRSR